MITPDPGNQRVTNLFMHKRFAYQLSSDAFSDVKLDYIPIQNINRVVHIVSDMYSLSKRTSICTGMFDIGDAKEERKLANFFLVNGIQYTSVM